MRRWHGGGIQFTLISPRGLMLEKMPNGVPNVFKSADGEACGRLSRIRQRFEQGAAFAVEPALRRGRDLEVTGIIGECGDFVQGGLGIGMIARGIVAVRGIEEVYVVAAGVEACAHDFAHLLESCRGDGAAAAADLEELLFVELPGL